MTHADALKVRRWKRQDHTFVAGDHAGEHLARPFMQLDWPGPETWPQDISSVKFWLDISEFLGVL